jgi:uncharacterized membrane protein YhaH (DUF805 family)
MEWQEHYSFMNWYLEVLKKYAVFDGRARRKEYWFFILFNILISVVLGSIDRFTGNIFVDTDLGQFGGGAYAGILGTFSSIYALGVMIPSIAVSVRRLHDTGRTGWWVLINFVPVIGGLIFLYFMVLDSNPESNEYGPSPKSFEVKIYE